MWNTAWVSLVNWTANRMAIRNHRAIDDMDEKDIENI